MQGEQLKLDLDHLMMKQHIIAVHDGDDGYIPICSITASGEFSQHQYRLADLLAKLDIMEFDEQLNYYIAPNSFYKPVRRLENVRQIRALYADIDCHHLGPREIKRAVNDVISFLDSCAKENIPSPSFWILTGRGLQLYWLIEDLPKQGVPLWQLVQDAITERLIEILKPIDVTVDNVSDIARILRLAGTVNTKSNTIATLIMRGGEKYRLDELIAEYFPSLNTLSEPGKKKAAQSDTEGRIHYFYNLYSLHYARLLDLVTLQELRKGDINSDPCRRRMVFLYRYWGCCYCQSPAKALEDALAFNAGFTMPLSKETVTRETRSAEKAYKEWLSGETVMYNGQAYRKGYNYRNSTLIRWLDITTEEQREMQTIIGTEEKYRRNNERRNKVRYGKDESGLTSKQRARMERDKLILAMHEQGLSNREVAYKIGIGETTVRRALDRVRRF